MSAMLEAKREAAEWRAGDALAGAEGPGGEGGAVVSDAALGALLAGAAPDGDEDGDAELWVRRLDERVSRLEALNVAGMLAAGAGSGAGARLAARLAAAGGAAAALAARQESAQRLARAAPQALGAREGAAKAEANARALLAELADIYRWLDAPALHDLDSLAEVSLATSEGRARALAAGAALRAALRGEAGAGAARRRLGAVRERLRRLARAKDALAAALARHLNNLLIHLGNEAAAAPAARPHHQDLLPYAPFMRWLKDMDEKAYDALAKVYVGTWSRVYEREVRAACEAARAAPPPPPPGAAAPSDTPLDSVSRRSRTTRLDREPEIDFPFAVPGPDARRERLQRRARLLHAILLPGRGRQGRRRRRRAQREERRGGGAARRRRGGAAHAGRAVPRARARAGRARGAPREAALRGDARAGVRGAARAGRRGRGRGGALGAGGAGGGGGGGQARRGPRRGGAHRGAGRGGARGGAAAQGGAAGLPAGVRGAVGGVRGDLLGRAARGPGPLVRGAGRGHAGGGARGRAPAHAAPGAAAGELPPPARAAGGAPRARAGRAAPRGQAALLGRAAPVRHAVLRPPARQAQHLLRGRGGGGGGRRARGGGVLPRGLQQARAAPPAGHVPRARSAQVAAPAVPHRGEAAERGGRAAAGGVARHAGGVHRAAPRAAGAHRGVLPGRGAGAAAHHAGHPGRLLRHRARALTRLPAGDVPRFLLLPMSTRIPTTYYLYE